VNDCCGHGSSDDESTDADQLTQRDLDEQEGTAQSLTKMCRLYRDEYQGRAGT